MATGFKTITTIQHPDPLVQRNLDEIAAKVNPVLRSLPTNIPPNIGMQPTVTGAVGGNVALASLIAQLVAIGVIKDGTS